MATFKETLNQKWFKSTPFFQPFLVQWMQFKAKIRLYVQGGAQMGSIDPILVFSEIVSEISLEAEIFDLD